MGAQVTGREKERAGAASKSCTRAGLQNMEKRDRKQNKGSSRHKQKAFSGLVMMLSGKEHNGIHAA